MQQSTNPTKSLPLSGGDGEFPTAWFLYGPIGRDTAEPDFTAVVAAELAAGEIILRRQPIPFLRRCYQVEWDLGPYLGGVAEGKTAYLLENLEVEADTEVTFPTASRPRTAAGTREADGGASQTWQGAQ